MEFAALGSGTDNRSTMVRHCQNPRILVGIIAVLAALACGRTASTPIPHTEFPTIQIVNCDGSPVEGAPWRQAPREDGLFAHLAERIPGFGGLLSEDGRLAVYLTDLDTSELAKPTLEWFLRREFPELADHAHDIHWLQGQYDWRQLVVWRDCLAGRFVSLVGAISSGLDEGRNRIDFGTPDEERIAAMKVELEKTVVPRDAVIFQRRGLACTRGWGPSVVIEIRDALGEPAAIGATVTTRKPGLEVSEEGFVDSLRVELFANNAGGAIEVTIAKPWYGEVVLPRVEVPEGPCGMLEPKVVEIALASFPDAPPVRQVVLRPSWYGFGGHNCGKPNEVAAYLLADPDVPKDLRWVSRDPDVVMVAPGEILPDGSFIGWITPVCRETYGATHVVAMAVADSTVRDSIEVSVWGE